MRRELRKIGRIEAIELLRSEASACGFGNVNEMSIKGDGHAAIFGSSYFAMLSQAETGTIAVCSYNGQDDPARRAGDIKASQASLVFADPRLADHVAAKQGQLIVFVEQPKVQFIKFLLALSTAIKPTFKTTFPKSCYIGPNVQVEEGVTLGENVELYGNNYVYANTTIGNNVHVKPGAVIGGEGYEHTPDADGTLYFMPHLGGVTIEDNVMIGSCTCIDRAVFGQTIIREGARIDNLVHIAHNVVVGRNSLIIANAMIGGSTVIGDNTRVAPSASLLNSIRVGDSCVVGMSSAVLRDVPSHEVVYGVPAKSKAEKPQTAPSRKELVKI